MPQNIEPTEAVRVLQDTMIGAEAIAERKTQLAQYASEIIRTRGELLIARNGMFGGVDGRIGSANSGVMLTQATKPVLLGDIYVALRDKDEERSHAIELVFTDTENNEQVGRADGDGVEVAATLSVGKLEMPNIEKPSKTQIDSVESVLGYMNKALEPLPIDDLHMELPRVETRNFHMSDGVHVMQEALAGAHGRQNEAILADLGLGDSSILDKLRQK